MLRNCVRGLRSAATIAKFQPRYVVNYSTNNDNELAKLLKDLITNPRHEDGTSSEMSELYNYVQQNKNAMQDISEVIAQVGAELQYKGYKLGNLYKKDPVVISVTGAAGQICYSLLPRIASGELLGEDQPVILKLIERPEALKALQGVVMELQDCAFPLLRQVVATSDLNEGFSGSDYAFLVGGKPRGPGMERADLLKDNGALFAAQGKALNDNAKSNVLVLVVGNPANTNALVAASNAPKINPANFSAMTRLDQDRAMAQVSLKTKVPVQKIQRVSIWGNHSATQYPDLSQALVDGKSAKQVINDEEWIKNTFIPTVQKRGAAIIAARGLSSAASAADAAIKHMKDWALGASDWVSMAVPSNGSYGIAPGVYCSYPIICKGKGAFEIVNDLPLDDFSKAKIKESVKELEEERAAVKQLLK